MQELPEGGVMYSVFAGEQAVSEQLSGRDDVSIAALNGRGKHRHFGVAKTVGEFNRKLRSSRNRCATAYGISRVPFSIDGSYASSVPQARGGSEFFAPAAELVSNLLGEELSTEKSFDADYWCQHIRQPVPV